MLGRGGICRDVGDQMALRGSPISGLSRYSSHPLSAVSLPVVLGTLRQPWSENIKRKISEVNNSHVLHCVPSEQCDEIWRAPLRPVQDVNHAFVPAH